MNSLTTPGVIDREFINDLYESQFRKWETAAANYDRLRGTRRKAVQLGALNGAVQCNPARIVSTGAKIDAKSISERRCFLCSGNRPAEQITFKWMSGWELLVNPFPIFPVHFTVAAAEHKPQDRVPLDMAAMAENAPELVVFFNGARAGASAPDHMHAQAVLQCELPLVQLVEQEISRQGTGSGFHSTEGLDLPYHFVWGVVTPDAKGMSMLARLPGAFGVDADNGLPDRGLVNVFFWTGADGRLRVAVVPRRRHRPLNYGTENDQVVVSPGAIDMAGITIAPREADFEALDEDGMRAIYADVAFSHALPDDVKQYFEI